MPLQPVSRCPLPYSIALGNPHMFIMGFHFGAPGASRGSIARLAYVPAILCWLECCAWTVIWECSVNFCGEVYIPNDILLTKKRENPLWCLWQPFSPNTRVLYLWSLGAKL